MTMKLANTIYIGSFILAVVFLILFVIMFYVFDIKMIISILSGEKQKRELKRIREENRRKNNSFVNSLYKPSETESVYQDYSESATTFLGASTEENDNSTTLLNQ